MIEDFQIQFQLLIFSPEKKKTEIKNKTKTKIENSDKKFC